MPPPARSTEAIAKYALENAKNQLYKSKLLIAHAQINGVTTLHRKINKNWSGRGWTASYGLGILPIKQLWLSILSGPLSPQTIMPAYHVGIIPGHFILHQSSYATVLSGLPDLFSVQH